MFHESGADAATDRAVINPPVVDPCTTDREVTDDAGSIRSPLVKQKKVRALMALNVKMQRVI